MRRRYYFSLFILFSFTHCQNEKGSVHRSTEPAEDMVKSFLKIGKTGSVMEYTNAFEVNNEGGHIQGIQSITNGKQAYAVMSGSSSMYAYFAVVKMGSEPEVIAIHKILEKPFKHAGGFQIYDKFMAVGVEDNEEKNKSKIYLYEIEDPEHPPLQPLAVIERTGAYERATAGCVGITRVHNKLLIVVGDWDTRHLDFYISDEQAGETGNIAFNKVYTIDAAQMSRENWVDKSWLSYQNINLIREQENSLYLAGLAVNNSGQDIADLFKIETTDLKTFQLKKVATRQFQGKRGTSFRWGAGVSYSEETGMSILSSTEHIQETSVLNEFK